MSHEFYMQRCLDLAYKALGKTNPNPIVGCVIVHQDEIIGEGFHEKAGENHAEINAIKSVKNPDLLKESTIYVSLEPCSHFGKTPPCANKIVEVGFKKVVIGCMDSNEAVNGKGKKIIEDAGIEVITGILEEKCKIANKRFFTFQEKKRPFIILKWAQSADEYLDRNFQPAQIGNSLTKQFVHQLRSQEEAILVGTKTALTDNPSLTTREIGGRNPVRILLDFDLKVPENYKIFNEEAETLIFNSKKNAVEGRNNFIKIERKNDIAGVLERMYQLQIQSVLIEGGAFTLQQFINENLWDEAIIIKNENLILGSGTKAPALSAKPKKVLEMRDNFVEFYTNF
ncbi:bifunctional diaminohydroxyphosphoribosylaminopyrimidine deaminase/5-amino-6-(5-phosphoribosylamino)uracil reductase RibD [Chryseobacterium sp. H3056]|uniref:Riboflavin biosynthesis protein RibD n=1 Tax=Kaistella daneshvariae TaxID=2487074 RepID=A0A3N0WXZ6_9FLAO|nr:bifunctional diaminohydroxyphosphoribosylaminopyrimidine deaminase/5-amino-6-(5-phosphoribosylamino)uracil reductase RibD [Kaistella daneshvariae]ROI09942.1 bifunctional diaminohydroxyphosphoribosylaminopyrimidine deaminase/5-amino-6-(5-phosphoribosylamino)uracil reductase RibD [Kaistella daneshvariae]